MARVVPQTVLDTSLDFAALHREASRHRRGISRRSSREQPLYEILAHATGNLLRQPGLRCRSQRRSQPFHRGRAEPDQGQQDGPTSDRRRHGRPGHGLAEQPGDQRDRAVTKSVQHGRNGEQREKRRIGGNF
jgi:hypothetical protein